MVAIPSTLDPPLDQVLLQPFSLSILSNLLPTKASQGLPNPVSPPLYPPVSIPALPLSLPVSVSILPGRSMSLLAILVLVLLALLSLTSLPLIVRLPTSPRVSLSLFPQSVCFYISPTHHTFSVCPLSAGHRDKPRGYSGEHTGISPHPHGAYVFMGETNKIIRKQPVC